MSRYINIVIKIYYININIKNKNKIDFNLQIYKNNLLIIVQQKNQIVISMKFIMFLIGITLFVALDVTGQVPTVPQNQIPAANTIQSTHKDKVEVEVKVGAEATSFSDFFGFTLSEYQTFRAGGSIRWNGIRLGAEKSYVAQGYKLPGNWFQGNLEFEKRYRRLTLGAGGIFWVQDTVFTWGKDMTEHAWGGSLRVKFVIIGEPALKPRLWVEATGRYIYFGHQSQEKLRGGNASLDIGYASKAGELHLLYYENFGQDRHGMLNTEQNRSLLLKYKSPKWTMFNIGNTTISGQAVFTGGSSFPRGPQARPHDGRNKGYDGVLNVGLYVGILRR